MASINPVLLDLPTSLTTERLILRVPQPGDGIALYDAVAESLPELRQFLSSLPWVAGDQSIESSEIFCRNAHANFLARRDLPFLIFSRSSGQLLGATGLHRPNWETPKLEIGYWCRSSASGHGLVSEAVAALVHFAFAQAHAVRVEIITDSENIKSRRVAEHCGFVLEGTLRNERRAPDGSLRNTCVYARTHEEP